MVKLGAGSLGHTKHSVGFSGGFSQATESVALPTSEPANPQHYFEFVESAILFYTGWSSRQVTPFQNIFVLMLVSAGSNTTADTLSAKLVKSSTGVAGSWSNVMASPVTLAVLANYYWTIQACLKAPINGYFYGLKMWRSAGVGTLTSTFKGKDVQCSRTLIEPPERIFVQAKMGSVNRPTFSLGTSPYINAVKPALLYTSSESGSEYYINHTDPAFLINFRTHSYDKIYGSFRLYHGDVDLVDTLQILQHATYCPLYEQNTLINAVYFRRMNPTLGFREPDYGFTS